MHRALRSGVPACVAALASMLVGASGSAAAARPHHGRYVDAEAVVQVTASVAGLRIRVAQLDCEDATVLLKRRRDGSFSGLITERCVRDVTGRAVRVTTTANRRTLRVDIAGGYRVTVRRTSAAFVTAKQRCAEGREVVSNALLRVGVDVAEADPNDAEDESTETTFVCLRTDGPLVVVASESDGYYSAGQRIQRGALAGERAAFVVDGFDSAASKFGQESPPSPTLRLIDAAARTRRDVSLGSVVVDELAAREDGAAAWFSRPLGSVADGEQEVRTERDGVLVTLDRGQFIPGSLRVVDGAFTWKRR